MYDVKIGGMFGVSKDKFDLPKGWNLSGYISDKGLLYSISKDGELPNISFFTEQELNTKILVEKRKNKINEINENKTSNSS